MKTIFTTPQFEKWFSKLRDKQASAQIKARLDRLALGDFGDMKFLDNSVSELRIHSGPGYRIYLRQNNNEIIILLCGGDKDSQNRDIQKAKDLADKYRE